MRLLIRRKYPEIEINVKDISIIKKISAIKTVYQDLDKMLVLLSFYMVE